MYTLPSIHIRCTTLTTSENVPHPLEIQYGCLIVRVEKAIETLHPLGTAQYMYGGWIPHYHSSLLSPSTSGIEREVRRQESERSGRVGAGQSASPKSSISLLLCALHAPESSLGTHQLALSCLRLDSLFISVLIHH
jgi:hypothetical protein